MNARNHAEAYVSTCPGCGRPALGLHSLGDLCPLFQASGKQLQLRQHLGFWSQWKTQPGRRPESPWDQERSSIQWHWGKTPISSVWFETRTWILVLHKYSQNVLTALHSNTVLLVTFFRNCCCGFKRFRASVSCSRGGGPSHNPRGCPGFSVLSAGSLNTGPATGAWVQSV